MNDYSEIEEFISENKIDKALSQLKILVQVEKNSEYKNDALMLISRFKQLQSSFNRSEIDYEKFITELNKIKFDVLQIADLLVGSSYYLAKRQRLEIERIREEDKIELIFKKEISSEFFKIKTNPNIGVEDLSNQILLSFEPSYGQNFLFVQRRIELIMIKLIDVLGDETEIELDNKKSLKENGLVNGDMISIKFSMRKKRAVYCPNF